MAGRANWLLVWIGAGADLFGAQSTGNPPELSLQVPNFSEDFRLPPVKDAAEGPLADFAGQLQVIARARKLRLTAESAQDAWRIGAATLKANTTPEVPAAATVFSGTSTSQLNRLIADPRVGYIQVTAASLAVDTPVRINRSSLFIDFGRTRLIATATNGYMVRIENATRVTLRSGEFASGDSAILINASTSVSVEGVRVHDLTGAGVVVTGSTHVTLRSNHFTRLGATAILLHRDTSFAVVEGNEVTSNLGHSNISAGIVLSDREVDVTATARALFGPDNYWVVSQAMSVRLHPPHDNVVIRNHVALNMSSGIYVDGGVRNLISNNTIQGNAKEGLCLDNGSTANIVESNTVEANGKRWGQPDAVLSADSVLASGRLADGTATAKVPGISIDNAAYNVIYANRVTRNYGGGIKMVRTSLYNLVGLNLLIGNNEGASPDFHFFGLELGAADSDSASDELDFTPSRGNILFSNTIRGTHYAGIFFASGSDRNDVFDNTIMDATAWALEAVEPMENYSLNNLTNLPSRNMEAGLTPATTNPAK